MLHEKAGKHGTRNRGRYQVAQSWLNRLYLFLNNENYDVCLRPYLWINKTQFDKNKYQILTYDINNTYAKLALDTLRNNKI